MACMANTSPTVDCPEQVQYVLDRANQGSGAVSCTHLSTKKDARNLTVEALRDIVRAVSIPVVAIGGINAGNIAQLKGSNVDGVAVISAIFGAEDPDVYKRQVDSSSQVTKGSPRTKI